MCECTYFTPDISYHSAIPTTGVSRSTLAYDTGPGTHVRTDAVSELKTFIRTNGHLLLSIRCCEHEWRLIRHLVEHTVYERGQHW